MPTKITTNEQLAEVVLDIATNYKTLYISGCFGAPMNVLNKARYSQNVSASRAAKIKEATADTYGFDCVCLIKGVLWGWCGDKTKTYGGAVYESNGIPDISEDAMITKCSDVSTDFSKIEVGEVVWMPGHIGVYVGNGLAVESSSKWKDGVQITACNCDKSGYNRRDWAKHGKLPYVTYIKPEQPKEGKADMIYYETQKDVPEFYRPTIDKLIAAGALQGTGDGKLNVSDDMCRILTILDRMGKL